jgi:hypothetical protein
VHYVGSNVCRTCHFEIYRKFSQTEMGNSMFPPAKLMELGWLTHPVDIYNEKHDRHYQIFAQGSKVYESEYALDDKGNEIFRHTEELQYVVGTGANGATPLVRRGSYLFQAPLSYYSARKAWGLSPNYEVEDMGFSLPVTSDCIGCHSGKTQPVRDHEGLYGDPPVLEEAVTCENCHGPGEIHVQERLKGEPVRGPMDTAIVNPAKLSPWLADNICMNCHEGDIRAFQSGKWERDFRPGTVLNDTVVIVKPPIDTRAEQSPLLEHYYSMTLSQCYRASGGKFGCQTCHDPHVQPSAAEAPAYFRGKCMVCHDENSCTLDLSQRKAHSPSDSCIDCHMTKRPALTVSHSTLTDHRITRVPDEPYPESALKPSLPGTGFIHVNAVPGEPDSIPPVALLRAYRQELIRGRLEYKDYYFSLLDRLSTDGNKDPFVLSALAQKASSDGDLVKAISYARQVVDQGSTSSYDYLLLDGLLARAGDLKESIAILKRGMAIAPYNSLFYENLVMRQISARTFEDALDTLREGLTLFPEDLVSRDIQQKISSAAEARP